MLTKNKYTQFILGSMMHRNQSQVLTSFYWQLEIFSNVISYVTEIRVCLSTQTQISTCVSLKRKSILSYEWTKQMNLFEHISCSIILRGLQFPDVLGPLKTTSITIASSVDKGWIVIMMSITYRVGLVVLRMIKAVSMRLCAVIVRPSLKYCFWLSERWQRKVWVRLCSQMHRDGLDHCLYLAATLRCLTLGRDHFMIINYAYKNKYTQFIIASTAHSNWWLALNKGEKFFSCFWIFTEDS